SLNVFNHRGCFPLSWLMLLYAPLETTVFRKLGCGKTFRRIWPLESMRSAGTMLPGKGVLAIGSTMGISRPFTSKDCEKLPARSSVVGIVEVWIGPVDLSGTYS